MLIETEKRVIDRMPGAGGSSPPEKRYCRSRASTERTVPIPCPILATIVPKHILPLELLAHMAGGNVRSALSKHPLQACLVVCAALLTVAYVSLERIGAAPENRGSLLSRPLKMLARSSGSAATLLTCTRASSQSKGRQQVSAGDGAGVPADFDWEAYLFWRPGLRQEGVATAESVQNHFLQNKQQKRVLDKRHCMVMLYDARGGGHATLPLLGICGAATSVHDDTLNTVASTHLDSD